MVKKRVWILVGINKVRIANLNAFVLAPFAKKRAESVMIIKLNLSDALFNRVKTDKISHKKLFL